MPRPANVTGPFAVPLALKRSGQKPWPTFCSRVTPGGVRTDSAFGAPRVAVIRLKGWM
jgi:hypothetical protein